MKLPEAFLNSLSGIKGFDKEAFEKVHASGEQVTSIRFNPIKPISQFPNSKISQFPNFPISQSPVPWSQYGFYLQERPSFTFDPLFHAGCYYVQEASSMFAEQAIKQTVDLSKPLRVLDLCAAPGGKSTHIQALISEHSLLVSNEVIRSRATVLKDNIIKWGCNNVVVTNNDPNNFLKLENYFDLIIIDAPCSGSGLFRREPEAIKEWSESNIHLCSMRQKRILADIWPALKKNGVLIYSTCSYSQEEDEEIADWLVKEFKVESLQLKVENDWGIVEVKSAEGATGYRFWPDKVKGEGFFLAGFRKTDGDIAGQLKIRSKPMRLTRTETGVVRNWAKTEGMELIKNHDTVWAWPASLSDDPGYLLQKLRVIYSGTLIGKLVRDKLVPDHALAMSTMVKEHIPQIELNEEQAIQYLKRKAIQTEPVKKGWQLVKYGGQSLGWVNILSNRVNNYYPGGLRIVKDN